REKLSTAASQSSCPVGEAVGQPTASRINCPTGNRTKNSSKMSSKKAPARRISNRGIIPSPLDPDAVLVNIRVIVLPLEACVKCDWDGHRGPWPRCGLVWIPGAAAPVAGRLPQDESRAIRPSLLVERRPASGEASGRVAGEACEVRAGG